jgi:hypothetical protein
MAMIHLARDGASMGSFPVEEVQEGLRTGRFLPTDMAWQEGMPDWRPLGQVVTERAAAATPAGGATDANALPAPPSSSAGAGGGLPWEHREQLGIIKAYFETLSLVLMKPGEAFAMMKTEGDLMGPMFFALIGGSAGIIVSCLFQIFLQSMGVLGSENPIAHTFGIGAGLIFFVALVPVMMVVGLFILSGILHVCLMIVGGANKGFETTFRVICFSCGSTYLLAMVPFCGGMIAGVWNIVLEIIGLARAHQTETGKAALAVLLPLIVCCGGLMLLAILGGFSALSLFPRH